ncbi:DNA polymerase I [Sulfurimonas sp. HSL3-7]|uniref:DNA polymerase I n=1 Tax=Sulfonitrofixus jiaomeiensis TaxID=3131938 RepID=UPI0031F7FEBB
MSKTITIIDTFGFFFRSFYALPPLSNKKGFPTGLLTGFTHFIDRIEKEHTTDYLVFALDSKGPTFRNEIDPNYKANRSAPPEELSMQLPIAIEWIEKMGFHAIAKDGFEADDIIASLTIEAKKRGYTVRVVSHDKDLYQLIDDEKVVLVDAIKRKDINEDECFQKYGIHPCQFTDYQAILGDSADNVPGVKGIGKVGAQKLLSQYGTLQNVYDHIDEIKPPGIQKKLREFETDAWMSQKLVTLRTDILEGIDFTPFALPEENPFIPIYDELVEYEMNGILRTLHAKKLVDPEAPPVSPKPKTADEVMAAAKPKKLDLDTRLVTDEKELMALLGGLKSDDIVAFDTETTGLEHTRDHLVGFSFALNDEVAYYVPVAHFYLGVPDQVCKETAQKALRKIFASRVVGHNIKFDLHFVADFLGVETLDIYGDSIVLSWLVNPESKHSLDHLAQEWLDHEMIAFKDTVKKGETFASVELEDAAKYAAEDALITRRLFNILLEKLKLQGAEHLIDLAHSLEFPFITTLLEMERAGIMSDAKSLEKFKEEAKEKLSELTAAIYEAAGGEFNINSPKQLGDILFDKLQLPVGKKRSTDVKVLTALADEHPIIGLILQYREMFKLYSTYIEPLLELNRQSEDGRIHTSFVQTGTATGRLSSKNPNLQNIPTRSELGARIREAFVAPEGKVLIGIDYSQIELRLLAHFSQDSVLVNAFKEDKDIHMQTAIVLFGEEDAPAKRNIAKTVNFGLLYGMGQKKLSDTLGITTKEAKSIIEKYFESFPTVKSYFASIVELSKEQGYVETLLGRRRYFDYAKAVPMVRAAYERESVNTVFQGSAADLIKLSMNKIADVIKKRRLPAKMLLQIHDELIFEADAAEAEAVAKEFKAIMESIVPLNIPLKTSLNLGRHWGELK